MVILGVVLAVLSGAGCEKDTDCKGDRVCDNGKCVSPQVNLATPVAPPPAETQSQRVPSDSSPAPSTEPRSRRVPLGSSRAPVSEPDGLPPPPPPPPQEERRVPLGNGAPVRAAPAVDACDDPLDADGRLKVECRVAPGPVSHKARRNRRASAEAEEQEEPAARGVGLMGVMYGALIAGGALPAFAFTAAAGVRFRSGVGFVGVLHGRIYASSAGSIQLYGLGPGVRFGNRSQLTLALTGTFSAVSVGTIRASGGLFSVLAQIAICLGDYFTLLVQPTIDFDASGVIGSITGGFGVTF